MNIFLAAALAAGLLPSPAPQQDRHNTASALQKEGLKLETVDHDFKRAVEKYRKSVDKAKAETPPRNDVAAQSLYWIARCHESMEPEDIAAAQAAYEEIVSGFSDQAAVAQAAQEKIRLKGVDVWIRQFHSLVSRWRDVSIHSPSALEEHKNLIWSKIQPLDKAAAYGLIRSGLSHEDEVIRSFAAEKLADVTDNEGIALLIESLNSGGSAARAGASLALQQIFLKSARAASYDQQAEEVMATLAMKVADEIPNRERDLGTLESQLASDPDLQKNAAALRRGFAKAKELRDAARNGSEELRAKAAEIRHNLPPSLDTPEIQSALAKILGDESANPEARMEAARALGSIGSVSGELAKALLSALSSKDRNVRAGAAEAAGGVDLSQNDDKAEIAKRLGEIVIARPEQDIATARENRDWANDAVVRAYAAESLGTVGMIRSVEPLLTALEDPDNRVRIGSDHALRLITHRDMGYDDSAPRVKDPKSPDQPTRPEAVAKWREWWTQTEGVVVLVERFHRFVMQWKRHDPDRLFDEEAFLKEIHSTLWAAIDRDDAVKRARESLETFRRTKEFYQKDALQLGAAILPRLLPYLGGEMEGADAPHPAVRMFVAETVALLIMASGESSRIDELGNLVLEGSSPAQRAGAAIALGFLKKESVTDNVREILVRKGLSHSDIAVRIAVAHALGRTGQPANCAELVAAAKSVNIAKEDERRLAIACLGAVARIGAADEASVEAVGRIVGHEPVQADSSSGTGEKSPDPIVREYAVSALGVVGGLPSIEPLIRARRDVMLNVREAAAQSIRAVYEKQKDAFRQAVEQILLDENRSSNDRLGAALALGDLGDRASYLSLLFRVVDENPPRKVKDFDAGVRIACASSLGRLQVKYRKAVSGLIEALDDESNDVRREAYAALRVAVGEETAGKIQFEITLTDSQGQTRKENSEFRPGLQREEHDHFLQEWRKWYKENEGGLESDPA